jgi:hypothetical protein
VKPILIDIDVILDVLSKREPFFASAAKETAVSFIISRNISDYKTSEIPATTPDLYLATLKFSD